ncbi:hypothetical protein [Morganella morganii]|uniref:hypothetical protein n=1 Tax=Morganella morganii TaxID=582 RepID=UPI000BBD0303|nr:hypothetical protein [Morganella morganii]ATF52910.1 hypothetical protein CO693_03910 [Morganella morganii]MDN3813649.1 hypothetical protein [Morganella morganii]
MEFKGTPGPWLHADSHGLNETAGGAIHGDGKTLCLVMGKSIGKEKATANAKLMAAAPEMIDFLLRINGAYYLSDKHQSELNSIIKKALGRE